VSTAVPSDHEIIHALADDLPVGLWVARAPAGEFVYANRMFAEIMGQGGRDDVQAGGYSEPYGIFTRDGKPYPEDKLPFVRALAEQKVVVVDDLTIHRPDGTRRDVRAFARPVTGAAGAITHVVVAFFDVTREAEVEKRLHRAQRLEAIGTLAGGIAHDFNNLIFGIKLVAADLAASEKDPARKASLAVIDDVTERSAMLTRSLLGFARRGKHRASLVALDDVIAEMRDLLTRTLTGVNIKFELAATDRGTVVGDQSQLEQVVMNLVVNARDAVRENSRGKVVVRTRTVVVDDSSTGTFVVLEVVDDGPGIPPEIRDRVFEPYFTTKTQGADRGTGLGLATVFGIIDSHGGTIEIDAGPGGRGTTMRVQLPAALQAAEIAVSRTRTPVPPGKGTILIVDDDAIVRKAVVRALAGLGYTPIDAADGPQAIEIIRQRGAEIRGVVLDMVMPTMSGRSTFVALRELAPEMPVLLMSGYTINDDVQQILDLGAKGFVSKPYNVSTLARALAEMLGDMPPRATVKAP
jgi:signal transduction histidine kinase/CheY-like chemotaxis protein